jgi:hypothetical protein
MTKRTAQDILCELPLINRYRRPVEQCFLLVHAGPLSSGNAGIKFAASFPQFIDRPTRKIAAAALAKKLRFVVQISDDMGLIADGDEAFTDAIVALAGEPDRCKSNAQEATRNLQRISQANALIDEVKAMFQTRILVPDLG